MVQNIKFANRHQIQEHLAGLAPVEGVIVEIGCGEGNGLLALAKGNVNNLPIIGIDPYDYYLDRLGASYDQVTKAKMIASTAAIKFYHIEKPALAAAQEWTGPISLLWIDLSMDYPNLRNVCDIWERHIITGGYLCVTGLCYNQLGTRQILDYYAGTGRYEVQLSDQDLMAVLRKL